MKRLIRKTAYRALILVTLFAFLLGMLSGFSPSAYAAPYVAGSMRNTMSNIRDNTPANHVLRWTLPAGVTFDVTGTADFLRVDFPTDFVTSGTWAVGDFAMTVNNGARALVINAVAQGLGTIDCTVAAGVDNVCVAIDTTARIFTIKPSSNFTATTADQFMTFTILGISPDGVLTNPNVTTGTSYRVDLAMCDEAANCVTWGTTSHTGTLAVHIMVDTADQVIVTATVDPTISLTLGATSVSLGTLSTGSVSSATLTSNTTTNAISGYSSTLLENNNLRIDGANEINDVVSDGTIDAGTEEYGISTSDNTAGLDIIHDANCVAPFNADPIISTAQTYAGSGANPGPGGETVTLCFAASIDGSTSSGAYTHTLTFVTTGIF